MSVINLLIKTTQNILMNRNTLLMILFSLYTALSAQTVSLTIASDSVCADSVVLLPVYASNMNNVGAITIYIKYDSLQIINPTLVNINSQLASELTYTYVTNPSRLRIAWSSLNYVSFSQDKLFDLKFAFNGISSQIEFTSGCEIANSNQIFPTNLINGTIQSISPLILLQPLDTIIDDGHNTSFNLIANNANNFYWEVSTDNGNIWSMLNDNNYYSGTHTGNLIVSNVPYSFNGNKYLCTVENTSCSLNTTLATLYVNSTSDILIPTNYYDKPNLKQNIPNPFCDYTLFEYTIKNSGNVKLSLYDLIGNKIKDISNEYKTNGTFQLVINSKDLKPGIFLFNFEFENKDIKFSTVKKIVKI